MYQTSARKNGTSAKVHVITQHLSNKVTTALDIGSQEGVITCRLADLGISAIGFEGNKDSYCFAKDFAKANFNKALFYNDYLDFDIIRRSEEYDAILLLSVFHQIAKKNGIEYAKNLLIEIFKKAKYQFFFEPCMIYQKHGCEMPYPENDYSAALNYFTKVLEKSGVAFESHQIGLFSNDLPMSEPFRPLFLFIKKQNQENGSLPCDTKDIKTLSYYTSNSSSNLVRVPLNKCIHYLQSFSKNGWHYFGATTEFLLCIHKLKISNIKYEDTPLFSYYQKVTPKVFGDFWHLAGQRTDIGPMMKMPMGYYCNWSPWSDNLTDNIDDINSGITKCSPHPPHDSHCYGPTADQIGIFEVQRLNNLLITLQNEGYHPEIHKDGYIRGQIFRNENDSRFMVSAGAHRLAILKALDYEWFTAKIQPGAKLVDRNEVESWPHVVSGLYSKKEALNFFDGLFNMTGIPLKNHAGIS